jgi:hypothetical protein
VCVCVCVCVVVRWSCVLQSTKSAEEPHLGIMVLGGGQGGKVVRVGRQSMQEILEMDELENEEMYMFIYRVRVLNSSQKHRRLAVSRPHRPLNGCGPSGSSLGDAGDHVRVRRRQ